MLKALPGPIKATLTLTLVVINTLIMSTVLFLFAIPKAVLPNKRVRGLLTNFLIRISERWIYTNNAIFSLTQTTAWDVQGLDNIDPNGQYMVSCNHQSWTDIFILQKELTGNIPFLKFFLKQELIWVPVIGIAWWALDFPFMKRYSKSFLEKNPHLKGKDLETTQLACEKFKDHPVSVMNFFEGTRNTSEKHKLQQSPYQNLLKPKAGGLAYVLSAMDGQLQSMVDVTIVYADENHSFIDFISGRLTKVTVRVSQRVFPEKLLKGDYENDPEFREFFQQWVSDFWAEKDQEFSTLARDIK